MCRDIVAAAACIEVQLFMRAQLSSARVIEASSQAFVCVFACVCALKRTLRVCMAECDEQGAFFFSFCKENQAIADYTQNLSYIQTRHSSSAVVTRNALAHKVASRRVVAAPELVTEGRHLQW